MGGPLLADLMYPPAPPPHMTERMGSVAGRSARSLGFLRSPRAAIESNRESALAAGATRPVSPGA